MVLLPLNLHKPEWNEKSGLMDLGKGWWGVLDQHSEKWRMRKSGGPGLCGSDHTATRVIDCIGEHHGIVNSLEVEFQKQQWA